MEIPVVGKTVYRRFDQGGLEEHGLVIWMKIHRDEDGTIKFWQALVGQPSGADYVGSSDEFRSIHKWHPIDWKLDLRRGRCLPPDVEEEPVVVEVPAATGRRSKAA